MEKEKQIDKEYSLSTVPQEERKSYASLTIIWMGFVFVVTSMMAGGGLAEGLDFQHILLATLIGNVFLCLIACLVSYIACKTGLTFALMTRYSFGEKGSRIASFFVPIVNLGWYTIQAATYGHFVATVLHCGQVGEYICMALSAVIMGIFSFKGIKAITILGYVAIPAIIFLSLGTSLKGINMVGLAGVIGFTPEGSISLGSGITAIIGTWILSTATCIADIMRYAKSTKAAVGANLTGLLIGNVFMILCGAITTIAVGTSDLTEVLLAMGLVIPSLILMTTNIFTTNASNLYSTSLNLSNALKTDRKKIIVVLLVLSALATLTKPYQIGFLFSFLDLLGTVVPPLAGIILVDFYLLHKKNYPMLEETEFKNFNVMTWISWVVSIVLANVLPIGLPSLTGLVLGGIIYFILMKLTGKKVFRKIGE
ncbi:cytosine permease [Mediterraneibacter sp. NSJ-151]|uniref:cytosine permease n=1 Tax=Mediterraneibacter sp. NSJ-151 TaxID=2897708 RepID=UPI001F0B294A|nr:cytosine permease [Mediterraneibacter sp. NSJ-151]MCH4279706.1 cytosine permease [Mediterraneibacter sp. NSJ-151]